MKISYSPAVNWAFLPLSNHLLWSQIGPEKVRKSRLQALHKYLSTGSDSSIVKAPYRIAVEMAQQTLADLMQQL